MVTRSVSVWAIACLLWALTLPAPATADPIQITGGFMDIISEINGPLELVGERGFSLSSGVSPAHGIFAPQDCLGCPPGTEVSLRAAWSGGDLSGVLTFEGLTYHLSEASRPFLSASVEFSGSFIAPPVAPSAIVTSPFRFTGRFSGENIGPHTLSGSGMATANLVQFFETPETWRVASVRYDFSPSEPVPEPGTLLMVGLGVGAVARRMRRARTSNR